VADDGFKVGDEVWVRGTVRVVERDKLLICMLGWTGEFDTYVDRDVCRYDGDRGEASRG